MSSRNKVEANTKIFQRLDEYCVRREEPITNAGRARWVETSARLREFLVDARLVCLIDLSPSLKIARFDHKDKSYFATAGFDIPDVPQELQEEEVGGGELTAILSEMQLRPIAKPIEIRQIIEFADDRLEGYKGHDPISVATLFPPIKMFSSEKLEEDESSNVFLLLCLSDRRRSENWMEEGLATALHNLAKISATAIPYEVLCRAVLDFDPAVLFLALYRSLEALYSRDKMLALIEDLKVSVTWVDLAVKLEAHLAWYPREEPSLEALFQFAKEEDALAITQTLGIALNADSKTSAVAARGVYTLRNALVHYRPFHRSFPFRVTDWNRLCEAMISIAIDLYGLNPK